MANGKEGDQGDPKKVKNGNGGGNGDKDKDKDQQDIDPTIASIMKDPDAVAKLLHTKRAANAEAKQLRLEKEALEQKQKEAEAAKLKEEGKYKELAEKAEGDLKTKDAAFRVRIIKMALKIEAAKQGISDPDLIELIDTTEVKIDDSYNVLNAEEVINSFKEKKPAFFEKKEGDEDDGSDPAKIEGGKPPALRGKVKQGYKEGESAHTRLARSYSGETKKKK
jgi:hypothetical protein